MKKLLAIALVLVTLFTLVACGKKEESKEQANPAIVSFVNQHKSELLSTMEESFVGSSGMTCTSSIEVEGNGIILTFKINELDGVADEVKSQMQASFDSMSSLFAESAKLVKQDIPELEYMKINLCEKDGDLLATVTTKA